MNKKSLKRKYETKLVRRVVRIRENRAFLLGRLKEEWEAMERAMKKDRRKRQLYDVTRKTGMALGFTILGMAAVCGVLVVGAVAPNIFSAFGRLARQRRYFDKTDFQKQVRYFRRRGYLETERDDDGNMEIWLTELGKEQAVRRALGELRIAPQERWDGMWRIVLFDIPERNKWARDGMRESLKRMGFYQMQKSVFVFPYPCRNEVNFLRNLYDIGSTVRFAETPLLNPEADLKVFFSLS